MNPNAVGRTSVAVFDLDGTLTWRDTLLPFLTGYLARHPRHWFRLWRLPPSLIAYLIGLGGRGALKSRLIRMVMGGDPRAAIDSWAADFVEALPARRAFRPAALRVVEQHRQAGDHLILMSASPDLYVPRIGRLLGFEATICTELFWRGERLLGTLKGANRRGEEKVRCLEALRSRYPGKPLIAYGNGRSDLAHLLRADRAVLVNARRAARSAAKRAGIALDEWR